MGNGILLDGFDAYAVKVTTGVNQGDPNMAKSGPKNVNPSSKGSSPTGTVSGGPGYSPVAKPFAKPTSPGQPASMKKALAKKAPSGKATGYAGNLGR